LGGVGAVSSSVGLGWDVLDVGYLGALVMHARCGVMLELWPESLVLRYASWKRQNSVAVFYGVVGHEICLVQEHSLYSYLMIHRL